VKNAILIVLFLIKHREEIALLEKEGQELYTTLQHLIASVTAARAEAAAAGDATS
jgi:hypothetical protein